MPAFASRSSLTAALKRGQEAMLAIYGQPIKLDGRDGSGISTAPRRTDQLDAAGGGYSVKITCMMRLRKTDWPAFRVAADFFKKEVQINTAAGWQRFRVADQGVTDVHLGGEWKLELEALT